MTHTHNPAKHAAALLAAAALILCLLIAPAAAFSGAGSGTEASPYIITTPAQLQEMANDLDAYYQLGNDIDMAGYTFTPIGSTSAPFKGVLNGDGHIISNLKITVSSSASSIRAGFIVAGSGCSVMNTGFEDIDYSFTTSGSGNNVAGGIIGQAVNTVTVSNCYISGGSVYFSATGSSSNCQFGGIVGTVWSLSPSSTSDLTISNCYVNNLDVSGSAKVWAQFGGIFGSSGIETVSKRIDISNCYVNVDMSGFTGSSYQIYGISTAELGKSSQSQTISNCVELMPSIGPSSSTSNRIYWSSSRTTATNNYAYYGTLEGGSVITGGTTTNADGANVYPTSANSPYWTHQDFWENTMLWDFNNIWYFDESAIWTDGVNTYHGLPKLLVFKPITPPTISAVTATPATGGQLTEYTLSATATTEAAGGISGYQWSYSTDSGSTWTDINGATTATYTWTPGQSISGTVNLKVVVTGADGGTADSYTEGFTPTITVVTPPAISSITTSRPLQKVGSETTLTAIFSDSQTGNTYQWYYRVSGGSWQAITGATEPVSSFTPAVTGTLELKIIATNVYSESSELSTTLTVLPTYTPDTISETTPDISISAENKYQATKQFALTTDLFDLEYFTPTLAYLAQGNAVYYIDSAEQEVIPVTNKTGNTITAAYIGSATAVLTDSSGNTAVYDYSANNWQYIEQNSATILAATTNYAATINGQTLTIYNLDGNKIAETTTTLTNLAGNDNTDIFAGYSGQTITYYWVSNGAIQTASQTITQTVTGLHQIPDTQDFVVSTNSNTLTISISPAGAYTLTATSDTTEALTHTQATSINVIIGVAAPNEIYVIGADGETDGTYVTGSTLNDASIAKNTGLYAITGGEDRQAYILAKSTSSTWQLSQVVSFGDVVDHSQISTTGTYAAVATGHKLYLLEAMDISTGTYMLNGVVINSAGKPYGGKLITINGDQIRTDTNGKFLYPVQPTVLYTIIADGYSTEYTATNAALQQIAIRLPVNPAATEVDYSAEYSAEAGAIIMTYSDSADRTTAVNWEVRESKDNTLVATYTGTSASFPVSTEDTYTNYYVKVTADRGQTTVSKSWSITPAGGYPVNLYGLDDNGKNIIFGFLLLIIAGLFGVMHSRSGAVLTAFAACIMRYLELITIPWIVILVAAVIAVIAAIAGGNK